MSSLLFNVISQLNYKWQVYQNVIKWRFQKLKSGIKAEVNETALQFAITVGPLDGGKAHERAVQRGRHSRLYSYTPFSLVSNLSATSLRRVIKPFGRLYGPPHWHRSQQHNKLNFYDLIQQCQRRFVELSLGVIKWRVDWPYCVLIVWRLLKFVMISMRRH